MRFETSLESEGSVLAEIRAKAMRPSLEALGRFNEGRVRTRFLNTFIPSETIKLILEEQLVGFYVVKYKYDCVYLDHLYIDPCFQNKNIGSEVISKIKNNAKDLNLPIKLGALRESQSNEFYMKHGFLKTHEDEFDIYYEFNDIS